MRGAESHLDGDGVVVTRRDRRAQRLKVPQAVDGLLVPLDRQRQIRLGGGDVVGLGRLCSERGAELLEQRSLLQNLLGIVRPMWFEALPLLDRSSKAAQLAYTVYSGEYLVDLGLYSRDLFVERRDGLHGVLARRVREMRDVRLEPGVRRGGHRAPVGQYHVRSSLDHPCSAHHDAPLDEREAPSVGRYPAAPS
jgi:hypothetical protein